jgi:hypothetical protein
VTSVKNCDFQCGRAAVIKIKNLELCRECADEMWGPDGPMQQLNADELFDFDQHVREEDPI